MSKTTQKVAFTLPAKINHRGRWQAQGGGFEESEKWAQSESLTRTEGLTLLHNLGRKISSKEFELRKKSFKKAIVFVEIVFKTGGVLAFTPKTFDDDNNGTRVDLEVRAGLAFHPDKR